MLRVIRTDRTDGAQTNGPVSEVLLLHESALR
jgi:hypothetical protein